MISKIEELIVTDLNKSIRFVLILCQKLKYKDNKENFKNIIEKITENFDGLQIKAKEFVLEGILKDKSIKIKGEKLVSKIKRWIEEIFDDHCYWSRAGESVFGK